MQVFLYDTPNLDHPYVRASFGSTPSEDQPHAGAGDHPAEAGDVWVYVGLDSLLAQLVVLLLQAALLPLNTETVGHLDVVVARNPRPTWQKYW